MFPIHCALPATPTNLLLGHIFATSLIRWFCQYPFILRITHATWTVMPVPRSEVETRIRGLLFILNVARKNSRHTNFKTMWRKFQFVTSIHCFSLFFFSSLSYTSFAIPLFLLAIPSLNILPSILLFNSTLIVICFFDSSWNGTSRSFRFVAFFEKKNLKNDFKYLFLDNVLYPTIILQGKFYD